MSERQRALSIGLSLSPTWLSGDAWRQADSNAEGLCSTAFYVDVAQRAEQAKLDFVFRADTLFLDPKATETGAGFTLLDPTILLAAIAQETEYIGLVTTASTTFLPPYVVARQLQSLHQLSEGRAGWNIVTALGGHENFGLAAMPTASERYARAAEFVEIVQKLWRSYPHEALRVDRASGRFADATEIRPIAHRGPHFQVAGPLNVPAWSSGEVPLFQAGASSEGRDFAASIADAVFAATPDTAAGVELRRDLRARASAFGRDPNGMRVLPGLSFYLATTRAEARALYGDTHKRQDRARAIAKVKALIGLDLTECSLDRPVTAEMLPDGAPTHSQTHAELLRRMIQRDRPTAADLLTRPEVVGSAHWLVVGTPDDALASIRAWCDAGAADGIIALPGGGRRSLDLFFDELMPRLADVGLFRREYEGTTLRDHLRIAARDEPHKSS